MQSSSVKSIAVLPFRNLSQDPEHEYLCDGLTEELINTLTQLDELKVTSRTSSFYFKGQHLPLNEIGKQLGVSTILEGSIRSSGKQMRISAQLVDVAEDYSFWAQNFDRSLEDIFAVQDEISLLIADHLREHLGHFEIEEQLVAPAQVSVDSYTQYLKSRALILRMNKAEIEQGIALLQEVVAVDPQYPYAYLGIHHGYAMLGTLGFMPSMTAFMEGQRYLDQAIALDASLPECQLQLSWMSFLQDWNLDQTYQHLQEVKNRRPIVDYYQTMASVVVVEGKYKAAMHYLGTAFQLDPFSDINYHLKGFLLYTQGQFEEAIPFYQKGIQLNANAEVSYLELGQCLILLKRYEEARTHFQQLPKKAGTLMKTGGISLVEAAQGKQAAVQQSIRHIETFLESEQAERALHFLLLCATLLGDQEAAIRYLEKALAFRFPMLIYLKNDPMLQPLASHPRFPTLIQQVMGTPSSFQVRERKYKKSLLAPEVLRHSKQRLLTLMEQEAPFIDPYLSLRGLAEKLHISPNQLSQLLNEGFDQNFSAFVNHYRLEHFTQQLLNPHKQHLTLLALAYESGFNSKSVFNTFFKKATGLTPKAYKNKLLQQ